MRLLTPVYSINTLKSKSLRGYEGTFLDVFGKGKRVTLAALAIVRSFAKNASLRIMVF